MRKRAESYARELIGAPGESIEARFQSALDKSWMAFQPIVDVSTRTVFAYEALIRTEEPTLQRRPDLLIATPPSASIASTTSAGPCRSAVAFAAGRGAARCAAVRERARPRAHR